MKINWNKVAKIAIPVVGAAASLLTNWYEDKKLDDKIAEKVAKALEPKE
jgi:hypothetical protein